MHNKLHNGQYNPAEDTFFLEDCIKDERGESALDIGTGSGYLTKVLERSFDFVVGTDINLSVLQNQTYASQSLVCCYGADAINLQFDLVICNLPYLATDEILDVATDGGREGLEIPLGIIKSVLPRIKKGGKFLFVTSSLSNFTKLIEETNKMGLNAKIFARKKLFFEELIVVEAIK